MNTFEKNISRLYRDKGRNWLKQLAVFVEKMAMQWNLTDLQPVSELSYHYVLSGKKDKEISVVLKLGLDKKSLKREVDALSAFNHCGCVKLLNFDNDQGALLLEKAQPGESLKTFFPKKEIESAKVLSLLMQKLHQAKSNLENFPTISNWLSVLENPFDFSKECLEKSRILSKKLLLTSAKPVLLHGDLHHDNVLSHGTSWVAIDPKGVVGEPAYEVGAFIRNPIPELSDSALAKKIIESRIHYFSKNLKIDQKRILDWSYVQSVLGACWMIEDNLDPKPLLKISKVLDALK